jgi:hypothetical protein
MNDIKYPVYRKFKNGKEFHKINSENESLSILVRKNLTRLRYSKNALHVADAMDEEISTESTREEWEKLYGETQWSLTKANQLQ